MRLIVLYIVFAISLSADAQAPDTAWHRFYGGSGGDLSRELIPTSDGGYFLAGWSGSNISGDKTENGFGLNDYWVLKLDSSFDIEWQKTIGGATGTMDEGDYLTTAIETSDGGFLVGGYSASPVSGNKTEECRGFDDYWIIKLGSGGDIEWQKAYGGSGSDWLSQVIQLADGGFLLAGSSNSNISGEKSENSRGFFDIWIVKTNNIGEIEWQKTIGGDDADFCHSIIANSDESMILSCSSSSSISGEKNENSYGQRDYWLIKISSDGALIWQKTIGGDNFEISPQIIRALGGDYYVVGESRSGVSGLKTEVCRGSADYWILKINSLGEIIWQKTLGGDAEDAVSSRPLLVSDGGLLFCGSSRSGVSGDKTVPKQGGLYDIWMVRLDQDGGLIWQKGIGGLGSDTGAQILQLPDGSFLLRGISDSSNSGDINITGHGGSDYWLVKLNAEQLSVRDDIFGQTVIHPNPATDFVNVHLPYSGGEITATVYDLPGRQISKTQSVLSDFAVELPQAEGIYLLSLTNSNGQSKTFKIVARH